MTVIKSCGRCGAHIDCRSNDISNCDCSEIALSNDAHDYLRKTKYECLCNSCLRWIDQQLSIDDPLHLLTEDRDYYLEDGLMVFTESYHIRKGNCCKNGCRHCAYGYSA